MKIKLILAFVTIYGMTHAQTNVDDYINNYMTTNHIPGMSACIVKNGKLAWAKAYGLADVTTDKPVTLNTVFMLASISKTITGDALMNEWEKGAFQLDNNINTVLPWNIHNPYFPTDPITFRQLMTHTSSIADNWNVFDAYLVNGDSPYALSYFMYDYLVPGSVNYDPYLNFYQYHPGDTANYSNAAVSLCGYLAERMANASFNQYCIDSIFNPLCMDNTSWFLSGIPDTTMIARPYIYSGGTYTDQGLYGFPDYPDGQLRTTVISLAKFLLMNMQYGRFGDTRVLDSATVRLMRTVQDPSKDDGQGLIWYRYDWNNRVIWGHGGKYKGYRSQMWMDSVKNEGVILLTNGSFSNLDPMLEKLFQLADTMNLAGKPELNCDYHVKVEENSQYKKPLTVYPNPFNSSTTIQFNIAIKDAELNIYNLYGQKLKTINHIYGDNIKIERGNLNSGLYFFELKEDAQSIRTGKMIITE